MVNSVQYMHMYYMYMLYLPEFGILEISSDKYEVSRMNANCS